MDRILDNLVEAIRQKKDFLAGAAKLAAAKLEEAVKNNESIEKDLDLMHAAIGLLHYEQCGDVNFQEVDKELNDFEKRMANS